MGSKWMNCISAFHHAVLCTYDCHFDLRISELRFGFYLNKKYLILIINWWKNNKNNKFKIKDIDELSIDKLLVQLTHLIL